MSRTLLSLVALAALLASQAQAQTTRTKAVDQAAPQSAVQVNLNTATVADLQDLPGVGAKVAARIVEYRQKQGPFKRIEELMNVQGIGEKSFLKLRSQLTVGGKSEAPPPPQK
jgi:competence protein ComEA